MDAKIEIFIQHLCTDHANLRDIVKTFEWCSRHQNGNLVNDQTLTLDFDVLAVSYETYQTGELINEKRKTAGKKEVALSVVNCVTADDGKEVSTTRIYHGEIDRFGKTEEKKKP